MEMIIFLLVDCILCNTALLSSIFATLRSLIHALFHYLLYALSYFAAISLSCDINYTQLRARTQKKNMHSCYITRFTSKNDFK